MRPFLALILSVGLLIGGVVAFQQSTDAAQNVNCLGSADYITNHQLADQALSAQISQHADIYAKDSRDLTPEDIATVAGDVTFYVVQLSQLVAPDAAKAALATEIAMYATLAAMLYTVSGVPIDLAPLYNEAGTDLTAALSQHAQILVAACSAYDDLYGGYLPETV